MDKNLLVLIGVLALLVGSIFYFDVYYESITTAIEARQSDQIVGGINEIANTATTRIHEQDTKVRTEVRYVYEQTRTRVNALPADDICAGLNAELSIFRGVALGAGELDDN
jgi:hypothetical protein